MDGNESCGLEIGEASFPLLSGQDGMKMHGPWMEMERKRGVKEKRMKVELKIIKIVMKKGV
ncbi:hypothetical protein KI387_044401, partial [Taxus chinensis]